MKPLRKITLSVLLLILCFITPLYAHYSNEYSFVFDLLRSLHYCQWAFVYEVKNGGSPIGARYDIMSANYKLKQAKTNILKYADYNEPGIRETTLRMIKGIDALVGRNDKLLWILDSTGSIAFGKTAKDNLEDRNERNKGIEVISASAEMVFILISDPDNNHQTGKIRFKISKEERFRLLKRFDGLFKGLIEWCSFSASLEKEESGCDSAIKNCMIFDLNRLREVFLVTTYEEAKRKGL